ncbi:MAG: MaoC family dehydratase N-terminal domain-containing protein [Lachnospiraceae bacterium]|nr:MaoC family dehydratase N-terminal domain-containing protein [Lachnospiraceae bacterium]
MNEYRFDEIQVGQEESFEITITEEMMEAFKTVTEDVNPLHNDSSYAKEKGFEGKVVFGMLTASFLSTMAGVYMPGKYSLIQSVEVKFAKPVFPGEKLKFTGKVSEKNDTFRFIVLKVNAVNEAGEKKVKASMQIGVME